MDLGLRDKVCVVTGSTAGIGRAVVQQLREEGAVVVSTGRRGNGPGDLHVAADLSLPGEPGRVVAEAEARFGRIDCLVNNVGGTNIRRFEELTDKDWQASFELNLMSAVRTTRAVLPGMRERRSGSIVNVSSSAGKRPSLGMPDYSVMKAGMLSFSRLVADLYGGDGIRCNAVCPGTVSSPSLEERITALGRELGGYDKAHDMFIARQPMMRFGTPEEVASLCVYLASDESSFVTGQLLAIDGGITI